MPTKSESCLYKAPLRVVSGTRSCNMTPTVRNFYLLLASLHVLRAHGRSLSHDPLPVRCAPGSDCFLRCTARFKPGVDYIALMWYKVTEAEDPQLSRLRGLLVRHFTSNTTRRYPGAEPAMEAVELLPDKEHAIRLANVTCANAGLYSCSLAAPVHEQNREGRVQLIVTGCPESPASESLMTDVNMATVAMVVLMFALVIFGMSYVCLRNSLRDKQRTITKDAVVGLDAPLKPLDKKDLMLISTLGVKAPVKPVSSSRWCWT